MTNLHRLTFLALTLIMISGCSNVPENSLSFDDIVYTGEQFPTTYTPADADTLKIPVPGVMNFAVADSLLLVSNNDNSSRVTVLSLDGTTVMGRFLRTGRGPEEVIGFPGIGNVALSTGEDGHLLATWDNRIGKMITWDITASLDSGQTAMTDRSLTPSVSKLLLDILPLKDNEYLLAQGGDDKNTIKRFVLSPDDSTRVTPPLERLNRVIVDKDMEPETGYMQNTDKEITLVTPNFNYINASYVYNSERGLIIEVERARNTINIFTLDGKSARTICTFGDLPEDVSTLEKKDLNERLTMRPKAYPDFFSVLHWNRLDETKYIWMFNYDGEALAVIPVSNEVTYYDIDPAGKCLYLLEPDNELLLRYDINDYLGSKI